jgi:hypothetical protein
LGREQAGEAEVSAEWFSHENSGAASSGFSHENSGAASGGFSHENSGAASSGFSHENSGAASGGFSHENALASGSPGVLSAGWKSHELADGRALGAKNFPCELRDLGPVFKCEQGLADLERR